MKITRRQAIVRTVLAGGAIAIGYGLWPYPQRERERELLGHGKGVAALSTWIKIGRDNRITIVVPHQDMGQGSLTGLAQMAADELDADWSLVSVLEAPVHEAFANPDIAKAFIDDINPPAAIASLLGLALPKLARAADLMLTGGSASIRGTGRYAMRPAGAAARELLVNAAAQTWRVPAQELHTANSHVIHAASGRKAAYGELIEVAATLDPPASPRLKTPDQFTLMGKPLARLDIPAKVDGTARYAIDVNMAGMKYAAIRHAPVFGGTVQSVDAASVMLQRGVAKVVQLPAQKGGMIGFAASDAAVAVIADNTWRAEKAVRALAVSFAPGANGGVSTAGMFDEFERAVAGMPDKNIREQGDVEKTMSGAAKIIEAKYRVPFLDHTAMEPHSTTAIVRRNGTAEIWTACQAPLMARSAVASALGLKASDVVVHNLLLGGGFGRRAFFDYVVQAARIAAEMPDTPVKLTWSREETIQHGKYRPACVSRFKAALDADGKPQAWLNVYNWHDDNAALSPYDIADQHIGHVKATAPIPTGQWRSVGSSRHAFFMESFVDELAHAAGADPYQYRRQLLASSPRRLAVLDLAAQKGDWGSAMLPGSGRGIAYHECFGTLTAQVADVRIDAQGQIKVDRVVCAIDCGQAINPSLVEAQIQGGALYGLSAALFGAITIREGRVEQSNFHDYGSLRLADAPHVEVHILHSQNNPGGAGEPGTPAVAPAVANAIFAATGQRLRELPFKLREASSSVAT